MPPVALAAFSFKVVILLLIHCLLLVQLAVFCVNNHIAEEEIDGHFTLILTWSSFSMCLPHGAMSWYAVCDSRIF